MAWFTNSIVAHNATIQAILQSTIIRSLKWKIAYLCKNIIFKLAIYIYSLVIWTSANETSINLLCRSSFIVQKNSQFLTQAALYFVLVNLSVRRNRFLVRTHQINLNFQCVHLYLFIEDWYRDLILKKMWKLRQFLTS